ncbi:LamG-like jellyroll fold domain-containing protein [Rosistilla oblonga]|uniref:LamG-like jellyroll fold domain-containing protein n=1 Tax=Rosistilla oblonga TaxID=2527990 RepID=UPI003A9875D5
MFKMLNANVLRSAVLATTTMVSCFAGAVARAEAPAAKGSATEVTKREGLVAFWDFQEPAGQPRISRGGEPLALQEMEGPIARVDGGVFGPHAARIRSGQWFMIPRPQIGGLDIHGPEAQVTVVAWIRRDGKQHWQAIAGAWDETRRKRQYCLFLNAPRGTKADEMKRYPLKNRIHGHVSGVGGPTPGERYCITYSSGATEIPLKQWHCLAMTYDGQQSCVYVDGRLDARSQYNPFPYTKGLFDGGSDGAAFTVGAVHRSEEWGNFFDGEIGGLAVFRRALSESELLSLANQIPLPDASGDG